MRKQNLSRAAGMGLAVVLGVVLGTEALHAADPKPIAVAAVKHDGPVDFEKEVLPILKRSCLACHNAKDAESDLVLETPQTILKGGSEGPSVVAGKGTESLLLQLAAHQKEPIMPPEDNGRGAKNLTSAELGLIKLWIDQGAKGEVTGLAGPINWQPLPKGVNPVYAVAVSPHGEYVAAGRANQIFMYEIPTKRTLGRLTDPALAKGDVYKQPGVAHLDLVQSLAFSPDGKTLASGGYREVKIWQRSDKLRLADWTGLEGEAKSLAVSADGKWAAIGEAGGKIKLFDTATGKVAKTLAGHIGEVTGLAFSSDGALLVSGSKDKTFRVWNTADGKEVGQIATPAEVNAVALVAEDKQVATGGADNMIRSWALPEGTVADAKPIKEIAGPKGPINALAAVGPTGAQLLSGSEDGTVGLWDVAAGTSVRSMTHGGPVTAVAVRPNGQTFASASSNNTAKLWTASNGQQIAELRGDPRNAVRVGDINREIALLQKRIANVKTDLTDATKRKTDEEANAKKADEGKKTAEDDLKKKDEAAKKPVADKEAADKELEAAKAELTKAQEVLAKAGNDEAKTKAEADVKTAEGKVKAAEGKVTGLAPAAQKALDEKSAAQRTFDAAVRSVERAKEAVAEATKRVPEVEALVKQREGELTKVQEDLATAQKTVTEAEKPLRTIAFSPDGSLVVTAGDDQLVQVWSADNGAAVDTFAGQGGAVVLAAFVGDSNLLTAGANKSLAVWDANPEWQLVRQIGSADGGMEFVDRVTALHFSPDGKQLATGGGEPSRSGELKIWNVADGKLVREIPDAHSDSIFGVEFSPEGDLIASCGADRFMKVFEVGTGKFVKAFEGHTHHVLGVSWRADGRMLATSGADNVVKVWNFLTGEQIRTIQGFTKEVTSIQFVEMSDNIVTASGDKKVSVKNAASGGNVGDMPGTADFMYTARSSLDGKTMAGGGQDSVVHVWNGTSRQTMVDFPPPAEPTAAEGDNTQAANK